MIAQNAKDGGNRPVYIVRRGKSIRYARQVQIHGPSTLVYGHQLPCGARAWIETEAQVTLDGECNFQEAKVS